MTYILVVVFVGLNPSNGHPTITTSSHLYNTVDDCNAAATASQNEFTGKWHNGAVVIEVRGRCMERSR